MSLPLTTARAIIIPAVDTKLWDSTIIFCHGLGDSGLGYDIIDFGHLTAQEDEAGLRSSVQILQGIVSEQVGHGIPAKRVILGGFSQGGVVSLLTGLTSEMSLGGIVSGATALEPCYWSREVASSGRFDSD
ncbi:hypothetical protein ABW19_dt0209303 [Dactylella cylindrospora]|nr:hypothetical protein ABW19_dt0209303 [Dactylella cylindrospora]